MISLLSPAKNMDFGRSANGIQTTLPELLEKSEFLAGKLKKLSAGQIARMMHINKDLAELNHGRFQEWNANFDNVVSSPAVLAFNGEVYRSLDAPSFSEGDMNFAQRHIRILSGLYGLLRPLDLIQAYRLEMSTSWKITSKVTNLYKYWGEMLSTELNEMLKDHTNKVVVNLASNEYSKAVVENALEYPMVHCHFLDWKNGEFRSVMTWAKQARGKMAREIILNKVDTIDELKDQEFDKYNFNQSMSDERNLIFTRK